MSRSRQYIWAENLSDIFRLAWVSAEVAGLKKARLGMLDKPLVMRNMEGTTADKTKAPKLYRVACLCSQDEHVNQSLKGQGPQLIISHRSHVSRTENISNRR